MLSGLADGVYSLVYRIASGEAEPSAKGLAVVRNNEIIGSDAAGGVFEGRLRADDGGGPGRFCGVMSVPPGGELITGLRAGPDGLAVQLDAVPRADTDRLCFDVEIGGQLVGVEVAYIGPLPRQLASPRQGVPRS